MSTVYVYGSTNVGGKEACGKQQMGRPRQEAREAVGPGPSPAPGSRERQGRRHAHTAAGAHQDQQAAPGAVGTSDIRTA